MSVRLQFMSKLDRHDVKCTAALRAVFLSHITTYTSTPVEPSPLVAPRGCLENGARAHTIMSKCAASGNLYRDDKLCTTETGWKNIYVINKYYFYSNVVMLIYVNHFNIKSFLRTIQALCI